MPYFHSMRQIRQNLARTIPNRQKRQFIAGFIEGHAAKFGSANRIEPHRLEEALKSLESNPQIGHTLGHQITTEDIGKIRQEVQGGPNPLVKNSGPTII